MTIKTLDYAVVACACGLSLALFKKQRAKRYSLPLPPGPPCWPFIGALPSVPQDVEIWKAFAQWGDKYGTHTGALK